VIRLLALILLALAVWRLVVRRSGPLTAVTIGWEDGTARTLGENDALRAQVLAIADRVAP
jgi:hypothetical protein